jgi:hypothetical protein
MLTTKLVILLVGGGAVIGAIGTRVTSDVMGSHVAMTPCQVIYVPSEPQRPKEAPVGIGKFSDLFPANKK